MDGRQRAAADGYAARRVRVAAERMERVLTVRQERGASMRASGAYHKPTHDVEALLLTLERAPALLIPLVREVPAARLKRRPQPDKWSAHEHACHLCTEHWLFTGRLERMLMQDDPVIEKYDADDEEPGALMRMDLDASLLRFARERGELVE